MNLYTFNDLASYLKEKGCAFAVKYNYEGETTTMSLIGISLTKEGKFFKANGKIVSKQMAELIEKSKDN